MKGPSRRDVLGLVSGLGAGFFWPEPARAFAEEGAFHARLLETPGTAQLGDARSAASRWAFELVERTSAPGRLSVEVIVADSAAVLREPFLVWSGRADPGELSAGAVRRLGEYLHLGGMLVVDDREPATGVFRQAARREMARVLPDAAPVPLGENHVLFKTFYILDRPYGRVQGPPTISAITRGKSTQVLFLEHDLLGALARSGENWAHEVIPAGAMQREMATRMAVNIAMYALCSDYKDDQVHAPFLMRRRLRR